MRTFAFLLAWMFAVPALAQRARADLACTFTGTDFVYDCVIRLTRGGKPLAGAQVTLDADMPSMPKMHAVAPVTAIAGERPGEYQARLDLEMTGEWAVRLRVSGPVRDRVRLRYEFDEHGARPARAHKRSPASR